MSISKYEEKFVGKDFVAERFVEDQQSFELLKKRGYTPTIIFDLGASNGSWSWTMKQIVQNAKFFLFEPLADDKSYQKYLQAMQTAYPHSMKVYNVALGDEDKDSFLYTPNYKSLHPSINPLTGSSLLKCSNDPKKRKLVKVMTLDNAIKHLGLPFPQVIKIDTQGTELNILKGGINTLPHVDVLFLECWFTRGYGSQTPLLSEIMKWLQDFNFRLWDVGSVFHHDDGTTLTIDCVFVNTKTTSGLFPHG